MGGKRGPARSGNEHFRIAALIFLRHMEDQHAPTFGDDLPFFIDSYGARTTTAHATAAAQKTFIISRSRQLDGRSERIVVAGIGTRFYIRPKGRTRNSRLVVPYQAAAQRAVFSKEARTRVAVPGNLQRHHIRERAGRGKTASSKQEKYRIRGAVLDGDYRVAVQQVFSHHPNHT